jgi:NADP-dependent 3-hydroxy acid dehydrogenase YdfG
MLVTGASSGVGRAIAVALAADGATVCLTGRDAKALESAASAGGEAYCYPADLAQDSDLEDLATRVLADHGRLDGAVFSAGAHALGPIAPQAIADLDALYAVNLRAPLVLTARLLPALVASRGHVVLINSVAGLQARAGSGAYAATKHGLRGLADSLRDEVGPQGVRVLSVYLGRTATPMQAAIHEREGRPYDPERYLQPEDIAAVVIAALRLPSRAEVTEITVRPTAAP